MSTPAIATATSLPSPTAILMTKEAEHCWGWKTFVTLIILAALGAGGYYLYKYVMKCQDMMNTSSAGTSTMPAQPTNPQIDPQMAQQMAQQQMMNQYMQMMSSQKQQKPKQQVVADDSGSEGFALV